MKALLSFVRTAAALAALTTSSHALTTVHAGSIGVFNGPDDLDLLGEIVYAINFSANDPALAVNGVTFTPDTAPPVGATFSGPNNVTPWQTKPEFGDSPSANNLEEIMADIRWANSANGERLEAHLPVTSGETYKLQILISGNHSADDRRWDIEVEGEMSVDEITSLGESLDGSVPAYDVGSSIVFTQTLTVADAFLDIRMGDLGGDSDGADRNPIWQGLIVERVVPDSDGDGLPDAWEIANFGGLGQTATGDFDSDGMTNGAEYGAGTNPNNTDTDGDGLTDGAEANTHGSNPLQQDSDGDGLRDDVEVNTHGTSPIRADTDGDGLTDPAELTTHNTDPKDYDTDNDDYNDGFEISKGTSPTNAATFPVLSTMVSHFTGGDPGEGLDVSGTFIYGVNVGTVGAPPGPVQDVEFTDDAQPGIVVLAVNEIAAWHLPEYGDTDNDNNLEYVMQSMRWSPAPAVPSIELSGLTPGKIYKLQLLFAEQCCANRGFDVEIDGVLQVDEFNPSVAQGGAGNTARGAVVTHGFLASSTSVNVVLNGNGVTTPEFTDHNAILNAVTLEELTLTDADGDGLADAWELLNFGDLDETPAGDTDTDGLTNQLEFTQGTNPTVADTDGDGLNDGPEVATHLTNPKVADTDGDGLSDGAEINTHNSNPLQADTDGDGYPDGFEVAEATNPNLAASYPLISTLVGSFTGGDPGEGLDLSGTFLYAVNVGTNGAPAGPVGDATFTDDLQPGILVTAVNEAAAWNAAQYGDTANDDNLEHVITSMRWTPAPQTVNVDLEGLTVGRAYKLQILFAEGCCANRAFDIEVEGVLRADEFNPSIPQGGPTITTRGSVVTVGFIAADDTLNFVLNGNGVTTPAFGDHNPILNGFTLESLTLPDTDGDGLPDPWEYQFFGDLDETGTGDPDGDTRSNAAELVAGSYPDVADSDGDGLNDGAEATAGTHPLKSDSDGDGLNDRQEVVETGTNPLLADTDEDTFSDLDELIAGSNPLLAASIPAATVSTFTGGDAGEGLDLDGSFAYAFTFGSASSIGQARDANFTGDGAAGITYFAPNVVPAWHAPAYGDTANDDAVELVMSSIRYSVAPATLQVNLANLEPGQRYKLQLLLAEQCCAGRGFDVKIEGGMIVNDLIPALVQEGAGNTALGVVVSYEFTARDAELNIVLDGNTATDPAINDRNPILNGVTLERIGSTAPASLELTSYTPTAATFLARGVAGKTYALDYSPSLATASWTEVDDSVVIGGGGTATATDAVPAHLSPLQGFWRLRDPAQKPTP